MACRRRQDNRQAYTYSSSITRINKLFHDISHKIWKHHPSNITGDTNKNAVRYNSHFKALSKHIIKPVAWGELATESKSYFIYCNGKACIWYGVICAT